MKQNIFEITQEEKKRIIYLHERRTSQHYLTEQITSVEQQTMMACGTGDLQQVKTINGKSAVEVDNVAHTICDNLKKKYPYEYKQYSPNHADSRSAANSRKITQSGGKQVQQKAQNIQYNEFKSFCNTKGLMSGFRTWLLTNNPKGLEQLNVTEKTPACDTKYYQLWYATLNTPQTIMGEKIIYLGELFKKKDEFSKTKKEALSGPDITSKKDSIKGTSTKHAVEINGQLYEVDGETGKANMVKLGKAAEGGSDIEDWINWISFAMEFIPGFGNLASAIVDVAAALVSLVKSYFKDNTFDKAVYFAKGSVGLALAFVPGAGNVINAGVKKTLSWLSNWWKTLLLKVTALVQKGTITKTLGDKFLSGNLSTVLGTIFTMLMRTVGEFGKSLVQDGIKSGIEGAIDLLNDYISFPGIETLINILKSLINPIGQVIEFINSFEGEIKKIPTDLSKV